MLSRSYPVHLFSCLTYQGVRSTVNFLLGIDFGGYLINKIKMSGGEGNVDTSKLTGLSKIFNSTSMRGRANVAIATYASIGLIVAYCTLKPKSKK